MNGKAQPYWKQIGSLSSHNTVSSSMDLRRPVLYKEIHISGQVLSRCKKVRYNLASLNSGMNLGMSLNPVMNPGEERRAQQAAAAEKRVKEAEGRGVKDPEGVKKRKLQQEEMEKRAEALEQTEGDNKLKWQVG
ncbi:hypothetical protein BSL78_17976 [Apostichopus japonicus]|uniref:Small VCP/p97-interacting protein n=1 Tax=Stichopus japonicus TaxID=307972 RepID=A0A2G8KB19_STIJA|nr:hypothetical protein BSL78_17976 [Apostichopus japonicus]